MAQDTSRDTPGEGNVNDDPGSLPELIEATKESRQLATVGIFALLLMYALYLASPILVPIALATLISMLLAPAVAYLEDLHVPRILGAAVVVLGLFVAAGSLAYSLAAPAQEWLTGASQNFDRIEEKLKVLRKPLQQIRTATEQLEKATELDDGKPAVQRVQVAPPALTGAVFGNVAQFVSSVAIVIVLLFLLLASGDVFLRKLITVIPTLEDKKRAVDIVRSIEDDIAFYLVMISCINIGIGIAVGITTGLLGIPNPLLWAVLAFILSFAPYIGEAAIVVLLTVAGMLTFDTLSEAVVAPAIYFVLMILTWHLMVPFVASRRLTLNPVAVFITIVLFGWMWGVIGALVAVPLLASFKIICERVDQLNPIAEFLTP